MSLQEHFNVFRIKEMQYKIREMRVNLVMFDNSADVATLRQLIHLLCAEFSDNYSYHFLLVKSSLLL